MRIIALIWIGITIGLSAVPCCVEQDHCATSDACCAEASTHTEMPHQNDENAPCSPFFACGSCACHIPNTQAASHASGWMIDLSQLAYGWVKDAATEEALRQDWKPPQLT